MKPNARRYRSFENDRGVVYLVPRPPLRWHPAPFWRTRVGVAALIAGAVAAVVGAGAAVIYLFR
jgi:hypothetical protein